MSQMRRDRPLRAPVTRTEQEATTGLPGARIRLTTRWSRPGQLQQIGSGASIEELAGRLISRPLDRFETVLMKKIKKILDVKVKT